MIADDGMNYWLMMIAVDETVAEQLPGVRSVQYWRKWISQPIDLPLASGPQNPRIEIIDSRGMGGNVHVGAQLQIRGRKNKRAQYDVSTNGVEDPDKVRQVSVFTTILRVLNLFEEPAALGRQIDWAFKSKRLKVYPRLSYSQNANYNRSTGSLNFFYFQTRKARRRKTIYTSASPDIVAHEAAHAVLDGIAPRLYDAITPQSLALHESIADLTAVFLSFKMNSMRTYILEKTRGELAEKSQFGWIAEQFGEATKKKGMAHYLRSMYSQASLNPESDDFVDVTNHHLLSVVFSAAVYSTMIEEFDKEKKRLALERKKSQFSVSGLALLTASTRVRRALYRALDYLPTADIGFLDLASAMIYVDRLAIKGKKFDSFRIALIKNCLKRGIGVKEDDFSQIDATPIEIFSGKDLGLLTQSKKKIESFIEQNRAQLFIPNKVPFDQIQHFKTNKINYFRRGDVTSSELIIKLSWKETEVNIDSAELPKKREIARGTTVVVDSVSSELKAIFSTSSLAPNFNPEYERRLRDSRDRYIQGLVADKKLFELSSAQTAEKAEHAIGWKSKKGAMKISGLGQFAHLWH